MAFLLVTNAWDEEQKNVLSAYFKFGGCNELLM